MIDNNEMGFPFSVYVIRMSDSPIREAFEHIISESFHGNVVQSLQFECERIQKAHDAIHEFLLLQPSSVPENVTYFEKSAFLTFAWEAFHNAHRSHLNALTGHYNAAYTLLRNVYELVVRGAFLECLSKYWRETSQLARPRRESMCLISATGSGKITSHIKMVRDRITVAEWISKLVGMRPSIVEDMKDMSAAIFDKLAPVFSDRDFQRRYVKIPSLRAMVQQLVDWGIIDIPNFVRIHDALYDVLSKNVHVFPDWTDTGRRILHGHNWMDVKVIRGELKDYMEMLLHIMDIAVVIEIGVMSDWIKNSPDVAHRLEIALDRMKSLGLEHGARKLGSLMH